MKPRWRWWIFMSALDVALRTDWRIAWAVYDWASLPEWWGRGENLGEGVPF